MLRQTRPMKVDYRQQQTWKEGRPPAASDEQREKNRRGACVCCGERMTDPAHLAPRKLGRFDLGERVTCGCDGVLCVLPLCRSCHDGYDGRSNKRVNLLRCLLRPELRRPEHRALYARLTDSGPATFAGLLQVTRSVFHPELRHAYAHLQAVTFDFPVLSRMLREGSRIFREDAALEARLIEIRELQMRGRL